MSNTSTPATTLAEGTPTPSPTSTSSDRAATPPPPLDSATDGPATPHNAESDTNVGEPAEPSEAQTGSDDAEHWRRHAREWERRAKRNAELAARFPDLEARLTQLQQQYEEAIGDRARIEAELWRERAARAHGIPDDLLDLLTGASETEVAERAKRIAAQLTTARRPLPDPTQGRGTSPPPSPADAFAAYLRGALNR